MNHTKSIFLLIFTLVLTPFVIFLGKNSLQTEFFSVNYFWVAFSYCFIYLGSAAIIYFFFNRSLYIWLFFAYFSFLQFYFFDIRKLIPLFQYGSTGFYILALIFGISLIATLISRFVFFRNFVLILLFLNLSLSFIKLIPVVGKSLQFVFKDNDITENSEIKTSLNLIKYPNIFYIVPDGLASPKTLKDYVGIEYQHSIKNFEKKGFTVPMHRYSSYNSTYLSLAALFAMDYPVTQNSLKYKDRSNFYPTMRDYNPKLLKYLKKKNYKFIIVPPKWGGCPDSKEYRCLTPINSNFFLNLFQDYAISKMFHHSLIKRTFDRYNEKYNKDIGDMSDGGKTILNQMKINPKNWIDGGVFTMIHMMIPHSFREEDCSVSNRYTFPSKEGYKSSVSCAFKRIHELSDFIINHYPDATIIVQSDHGFYRNKEDPIKPFQELSNSVIDERLSSFTAVRGCNSDEAAKLNQANIVESIVTCLTNEVKNKKFENKSFYGFYEKNPEFGKVYQIVKN